MKPKKKIIKFYLVRKKDEQGDFPVEWDETRRCEICDKSGSYWIGGNCSLCKNCVRELARFFSKISR